MGGMTDEWFDLGVNISLFGSFAIGDEAPVVFRPPGYPFFVGAVLTAVLGTQDFREVDTSQEADAWKEYDRKAKNAIYVAQGLLLALSTILFFLWTSRVFSPGAAFFGALLFGVNPYTIILTGLLHYDILHMFLILAGSYSLYASIVEHSGHKGLKMALSGVLWGAATLVRPVTLTLPAFVIIMLLIKNRFSLMPALKVFIPFLFGMALVISPYTLRNYSITGRLIPVNAQGWTALWGSSVTDFSRNPNHYNWYKLFPEHYEPVFYRATGKNYDYVTLIKNNIKVEDEFRKSALENLEKKPLTYIHNIVNSFITLNLDINSVFIRIFQYLQGPGTEVDKGWFVPGAAQDFNSSSIPAAFAYFTYMLLVLALAGICLAVRKRELFFLVTGFVYLCLAVSHSISYMDLMYYYIKIPFLFLFSFYAISELRTVKILVPFHTVTLCSVLIAALTAFCLYMTFSVI